MKHDNRHQIRASLALDSQYVARFCGGRYKAMEANGGYN